MPKKTPTTDKKRVAHLRHGERRPNIPTAELDAVAGRTLGPAAATYDREVEGRDGDLDPQLVWRGKDRAGSFEVPAPPLFIQEKVHPKALVDDLRRHSDDGRRARGVAAAGGVGPQAELFADFNGLTAGDAGGAGADARTEFYAHEQHWTNRMILGDSLQVMASLAEREGLRGRVQCAYLDPPYGIKFNSNFQWSTASRDVKDGHRDHVTREPEQVKAFRDTWRDGVHSYLTYLRDRLHAVRDLLHESGSCFVQIGDENVHRVRCLMDEVFGEENFCGLITIAKTSGASSPTAKTNVLASVCDYIVWFARDIKKIKYRQPYKQKEAGDEGSGNYRYVETETFVTRSMSAAEMAAPQTVPDGARIYRLSSTSSQTRPKSGVRVYNWQGRDFGPERNRGWSTTEEGIGRLDKADRLYGGGRTLSYRRYFDDFPVSPLPNFWTDTNVSGFGEKSIYVVQTLALIVQRCLLMATDPGDLVLDPTCGSGTTAVVAEQWGRRWITADTSRVALALARARVMGARFPWYLPADSAAGRAKEAEVSGRPVVAEPPASPDGRADLRQGFVYERVPHVTLKSIANNAHIDDLHARYAERLDPLLDRLNAALGTAWREWEVPRDLPDAAGGPNVTTSDPNASTSDPNVTTSRPNASTSRPNSSTLRPNVTTLDPNVTTLDPNVTTSRPNASTLNPNVTTLDPNVTTHESGAVAATARRGVAVPPSDAQVPRGGPADNHPAALLAEWWRLRVERQKEIDASIEARGREEGELLYDRPYADKSRVRVAGPFTVESLSPHRIIGVDEDGRPLDPLAATREGAGGERAGFAAMVLEQLRAAGVQQADRGARLTFDDLRPRVGRYVAAAGTYAEADGTRRRAGVLIGPEFGTLTRADLLAGAAEARAAGLDLLVAAAFAFDPHAGEADSAAGGGVPVLRARMNHDLHMAGVLADTAKGNAFVSFGEPDARVLPPEGAAAGASVADCDWVRVEVLGVDTYHPGTGRVESEDAADLACWFLDTDYDGQSFFVRQAFFVGQGDPYESLRRTLKAEIDPEAWETVTGTVSRAFRKPPGGRIAVKVINLLGDEAVRVMRVE